MFVSLFGNSDWDHCISNLCYPHFSCPTFATKLTRIVSGINASLSATRVTVRTLQAVNTFGFSYTERQVKSKFDGYKRFCPILGDFRFDRDDCIFPVQMGRFHQLVPQAGAGYEEGGVLDKSLRQLEEKIDVAMDMSTRDGRVLDRLKKEVSDMREMQLDMNTKLSEIMEALKIEHN